MKKKVKIAAKNIHESLHREPCYVPHRLKFIPNIIVNSITLLIAIALVSSILYLLFSYLIKAFYHLK